MHSIKYTVEWLCFFGIFHHSKLFFLNPRGDAKAGFPVDKQATFYLISNIDKSFHVNYVLEYLSCVYFLIASKSSAQVLSYSHFEDNTQQWNPCPFKVATSTMLMKCRKNSWASCCRLVENSGWPLPTRDLNIRGAMPSCIPCKDRRVQTSL